MCCVKIDKSPAPLKPPKCSHCHGVHIIEHIGQWATSDIIYVDYSGKVGEEVSRDGSYYHLCGEKNML